MWSDCNPPYEKSAYGPESIDCHPIYEFIECATQSNRLCKFIKRPEHIHI